MIINRTLRAATNSAACNNVRLEISPTKLLIFASVDTVDGGISEAFFDFSVDDTVADNLVLVVISLQPTHL